MTGGERRPAAEGVEAQVGPGRPRRRALAAAEIVALAAVAVALAFLWTAHHEGSRISDAFSGADQSESGLIDPGAHVGEPVWLGLPVMQLALRTPIRITSARLLPAGSAIQATFFDAPLFGVNAGRHIDVISQAEFVRFGLHTAGPLVGTVFKPGEPTHYGLVRLVFMRPGHYVLRDFVLHYSVSSGARGTQHVIDRLDVTVWPPN